jgi:hypothetical protein
MPQETTIENTTVRRITDLKDSILARYGIMMKKKLIVPVVSNLNC